MMNMAQCGLPAPERLTQSVLNPNALPPVEDPLAPAVVSPRVKPTDKPTEFPDLAAQPAPRQPSSTEAQKREIRDSLVADRDRAQYSADDLRGGAQPAAAPPAPAATKPAAPVEKTEEKSGDEYGIALLKRAPSLI